MKLYDAFSLSYIVCVGLGVATMALSLFSVGLLPPCATSGTYMHGTMLTCTHCQIDNARSKFKLDERIPEIAQTGKDKIDGFRRETRDKINTNIDQADRTVEQKASEAKGTVSGWFGGKK